MLLYFLPELWNRDELRKLARAVPAVALAALAGMGITLVQNKQVTGSWTTLPAMLSQYQYGVPASLTFQAHAVPHRELTPQQELDYKMQRSFRGNTPETIGTYLLRLEYRVRYYRFFFLVPLYLALPAFLVTMRHSRFAWVALSLVIFALGVNFFPAFQFHYVAAIVCLFVLASVTGLERLSRLTIRSLPVGRTTARLIVFVCAAHFLFWYGLHLFDDQPFSLAMRQYETWNAIDHGDPGGRVAVQEQLERAPGKHLVFVRYWPQHIFQQEWVYNAADIDGARIVWARDLGTAEDEKLRHYYPDRTVWLLEPDARPPKLTSCDPAASCLSPLSRTFLAHALRNAVSYAGLMRQPIHSYVRIFLLALLATLCLSQDAADPWAKSDLLEPAALAQEIRSAKPPQVLCVAFPVLYRSKHILHAVDAGPGSKPEGLEALKKAAAALPKNADIVIYCGCCPMVKCPNIRPAYRTLKEMGFTHIRVLNIATNMHADWYSKDYPSEAGSAAASGK